MVQVIGAPFDLCGLRLGSRLGPDALRLAGLVPALEALDISVLDRGNCRSDLSGKITEPEVRCDGLRNFDRLVDCADDLRRMVGECIDESAVPVVLGGDHSLAMAGISAALERMPEDLAVLWIDAHADVNTPGTSQTGNVHGMPLAALWGLPSGTTGLAHEQWEKLLHSIGRNALSPNRTCWYGLRDLDPAEQKRVRASAVTMHEIDRVGVEQSISRLIQWVEASGAKGLWVSFDVDVLDPILAPGTGTAVRGGLTYREGHLLAELLHEQLQASEVKMVGLDVVETNPLFDRNNETAKVAVEWIASLFGKTILG